MSGPYEENGEFRKFSKDLDPEELKWHRDREDRTVNVVNDNDWMFQRDNALPEPMKGELKIAKGEWHRVIKGTTDLEVKVVKY